MVTVFCFLMKFVPSMSWQIMTVFLQILSHTEDENAPSCSESAGTGQRWVLGSGRASLALSRL